MFRFVAIASALIGCRVSLEESDNTTTGDAGIQVCTVSTTVQSCLEAVGHSDLAWIEQKIFTPSCSLAPGTSCHGSSASAGKINLSAGASRNSLVNIASRLEPTRKLVVPNDPAASYLMLMVRAFPPAMASPPGNPPPASVGFMPQSTTTPLCCQKLEALERWIHAGAPNN